MWVIIFDINIISHHTITSFRIALHHTSYRIGNKVVEGEEMLLSKYLMNYGTMCRSTKYNLWQIKIYTPRKSSSTKILYKSCGIEGVIFSLRSMKRREGVFRRRLKNAMYTNFMHRKEIYYINIHTNVQCLTHIQILHFLVHKNSVFFQYLLGSFI